MNAASHPYQVTLAHQAVFDVSDASGVAVRCDQGSVWITLDNDPRDIVLEAGESFKTDERRRALIYALQPSRLTLKAAGQARPEPARVSFTLATRAA